MILYSVLFRSPQVVNLICKQQGNKTSWEGESSKPPFLRLSLFLSFPHFCPSGSHSPAARYSGPGVGGAALATQLERTRSASEQPPDPVTFRQQAGAGACPLLTTFMRLLPEPFAFYAFLCGHQKSPSWGNWLVEKALFSWIVNFFLGPFSCVRSKEQHPNKCTLCLTHIYPCSLTIHELHSTLYMLAATSLFQEGFSHVF